MNQTWVIITLVYPLIGFLFFLALDGEEMQEHVPYGELPAVASLGNFRWMMAMLSCGLWLPALVAGCMAEIWQFRKGKSRLSNR